MIGPETWDIILTALREYTVLALHTIARRNALLEMGTRDLCRRTTHFRIGQCPMDILYYYVQWTYLLLCPMDIFTTMSNGHIYYYVQWTYLLLCPMDIFTTMSNGHIYYYVQWTYLLLCPMDIFTTMSNGHIILLCPMDILYYYVQWTYYTTMSNGHYTTMSNGHIYYYVQWTYYTANEIHVPALSNAFTSSTLVILPSFPWPTTRNEWPWRCMGWLASNVTPSSTTTNSTTLTSRKHQELRLSYNTQWVVGEGRLVMAHRLRSGNLTKQLEFKGKKNEWKKKTTINRQSLYCCYCSFEMFDLVWFSWSLYRPSSTNCFWWDLYFLRAGVKFQRQNETISCSSFLTPQSGQFLHY